MTIYAGNEAKAYAYHQVSGYSLTSMTGDDGNLSVGLPYYVVNNLAVPTLTVDTADVVIYNTIEAENVSTNQYEINTGSKGITLLAAYNTTARSGDPVTMAYKAREQCMYAQGVTMKIDHKTEPIFGMGSRSALDLKEGEIEVSGTLDQFYNNSTFACLNSSTGVQGQMLYELWPAGNTSYVLRATEAKFKGYALDCPHDGKLTEKVEYAGKFYSSS